MVKVCHMSSGHYTEDTRIFHKECVSLANAGYDVALVVRGESHRKNGVDIVGIGYPGENRLARMTTFAKKVYKTALRLDADIYHFHDPELMPYGLKLKRKGKVVIFDCHENFVGAILEKTWIPAVLRETVSRLFSKYQKHICSRLDAVVIAHANLKDYFYQANHHVYAISNYPDFDLGVKPPDMLSKRIVYAGGIGAQWNHINVLKALAQLPDMRFSLCGEGEPGYMDKMRQMPGWSQVDYYGRIPHEKVAEIMAGSSIGLALLCPGENTDWNNGNMANTKIFEEMMAELPVVCTKFVRWKEFVERYNCGICVDPQNVDEIVSAIRYLADHPNEARQMGRNGRRAVKEEFNWGVEKRKLLRLYEDVLS